MKTLAASALIVLMIAAVSSQTVPGAEWQEGSQVTAHAAFDMSPSLLHYFQNNTAWVFWSSDLNDLGRSFDLYYRIYQPSCLQSACFLPQILRLTSDPSQDIRPSVAETPAGRVWVVWQSDRTGNQDVFYKFLNGSSWTGDIQLSTYAGSDRAPSVLAKSDGSVWVAWVSGMGGGLGNIFLTKFNGTGWSPLQQITTSGRDSAPSLAESAEGLVWIAWSSDRLNQNSGHRDLFYKISYPNGTLSSDTRLTTDRSANDRPSVVAVRNGGVAVVWTTDRNSVIVNGTSTPEFDLYFKSSTNLAASWSADTKLTVDPPAADVIDDLEPHASQLGQGKIGIVWESDRTGNPEIFSATLLVADVALTAVSPALTVLSRGETLVVNITLANLGLERETLGVTLMANGTQVSSATATVGLASTQRVTMLWDTTGWALGRYVLTARADTLVGEANATNNALTTTVTLTIQGDVNGDRVVNVVDLAAVALAFGTSRGGPGYSPNADLTRDGVINILDLVYVAVRVGTTG